MNLGNSTDRRRRLVQFALLYTFSIVALIAAFLSLMYGRQEVKQSAPFAGEMHAAGVPAPISNDNAMDSLRKELNQAMDKLNQKDSLIAVLQTRPVTTRTPEPMLGDAKTKSPDLQVMQELQVENDMVRDSIQTLQSEKAEMQQKLDEAQKTIRTKVTEAAHGAASLDQSIASAEARSHDLATKNAVLEKQSSELTDQLRFAEVDCNLSRADARQVVYNDRQRQDLLAEALHILNELAKSSDPDVQRKANEKLTRLRSIAKMVHD